MFRDKVLQESKRRQNDLMEAKRQAEELAKEEEKRQAREAEATALDNVKAKLRAMPEVPGEGLRRFAHHVWVTISYVSKLSKSYTIYRAGLYLAALLARSGWISRLGAITELRDKRSAGATWHVNSMPQSREPSET